MKTEAQKKAQRRYEQSGKVKRVYIKLTARDADILRHLAGKENVTAYIKSLIRKEMGEG